MLDNQENLILAYIKNLIETKLTAENVLHKVVYPDEKFDLIDEATGNPNFICGVEIDSTVSTQNSIQGSMVYGDNFFDIVCFRSKNNQAYITYFADVVRIKNYILTAFSESNYIKIIKIQWSDITLGDISGTGFILTVQTSINSHDYNIT